MNIKVGDIVGRRSYNCDLLFRVVQMNTSQKYAELFGEDYRLVADAPIEDLIVINERDKIVKRSKTKEREDTSYRLFRQEYHLLRQQTEYSATSGYATKKLFFEMPGRVLHLDGDPIYLNKCMELYNKLGVPVQGVHMAESEMPHKVSDLLEKVNPDILVITGHDAYSKNKGGINELNAYRHSRYFGQAVRKARKYQPHLDQLVIFAGACQSHFESLIRAGANFASSPSRINIHALDPVYIVAKISYTSFMERINVWDVLRNTLTGDEGLGGVETRGILRTGMPYKENKDTNNIE
jgi:spore coat assemly protein